jgi:hypothetical protein
VSVQRWVVARKTHRCTICRDIIQPGAVYRLSTMFPSDDDYGMQSAPVRYRTCQPCAEGKRWTA